MSNGYVTDNGYQKLSDFALKYHDSACLGYTHGQPVRTLLLPSHLEVGNCDTRHIFGARKYEYCEIWQC